MATQEGIWVFLDEKPSDIANSGIPQKGEIVRVEYLFSPTNPSRATRVGSSIEDKNVFKKRTVGATLIYSAN